MKSLRLPASLSPRGKERPFAETAKSDIIACDQTPTAPLAPDGSGDHEGRHATISSHRPITRTAILAAYFVKTEEAAHALGILRKRGFRRIALLHKGTEGVTHARDLFSARRTLLAFLAAVAFGVLSVPASLVLGWPPLEAGLAGGLIGFLAGWASTRRSRHGIARRLLKDHARWLVSDETVLILQAPVRTLHAATSLLRERGDIPPAVFILHPKRETPAPDPLAVRAPFRSDQLRERAERLAIDHPVDPARRAGGEILTRLHEVRRQIHDICEDLTQAGRLDQGTPPTAEWILDNEYIVESNALDVQVNLPLQFCRQLPSLTGGNSAALPRIYSIADELVAALELPLDRENICAFVAGYQSAGPLTMGELWALPQVLRIALLERVRSLSLRAASELREREIASFWSNRLICATRRGPDQLFAILAELAVAQPQPSPYFAAQLVDHLYDEEAVLVLVQTWLERTYHRPLHEITLSEQNRQTRDQISIGNAFTSLRHLSLLDWRQIFEVSSRVEQLLRTDPAGIYQGMDFETRDRYRRTVEELSRLSGLTEDGVARQALALAKEAAEGSDDDGRRRHVGSWLIGESRRVLAQHLHCKESRRHRLLRWIYQHSAALYVSAFGTLTILFVLAIALVSLNGHPPYARLLAALLLILPASQLVIELLNYLVTRLLPPRALPKMDFKVCGIPDEFRTLVVVPMLLGNVESIQAEVEKLEVRYLANRETNLLFSLFADYRDAEQAHHEDDVNLLQAAVDGMEALNRRHGEARFLLFHRERGWSESEQKFIGWERKRGKLEELNGLISGSRPVGSAGLVRVGDPAALRNVRFVITLDTDTQLPPGTARRMVETLAHPLNQPRFDRAGRVEAGTYTIIQPRVSPSLPSASASLFSRLFADAAGVDPYTRVVSDAQQDLTGEGSYYGKGIYDVRAFDRVLHGRFPEERLLSHD
ncbi:MAG TPA: glycosyl transferase, partial [Spirochaetia bacterium]|nr:glycosyl transferase [Spirochaetia bacterium]